MSMDIDHDVPTVLAELRMEADAEIQPLFYTLEDLWERKLWHQLTDALTELYSNEKSIPIRYPMFKQFISNFQSKINQLSLVRFGLLASQQCSSPNDALVFLQEIAKQVKEHEQEERGAGAGRGRGQVDEAEGKAGHSAAYVYAELEIARVRLTLQQPEEAKQLIDEAGQKLDSLEGTSPQEMNLVNAAFYGVSSEYYKFKADFTTYYRNALLYLACINLADISQLEQQQKAYDLAIAALLGDKVFNFGELLLHPILDSLKSTQYGWLVELLYALNAGDIKEFDKLTPNLSKQPLLENSLPFLRQKICLTALIEAVFRRPTSDRTLTFETIAKDTNLVNDEVEHLIMRALSLGLLRGFIDQVSETVVITWVQPRVMNMAQIANMRDRLVMWDADVNELTSKMKKTGTEIWTSA